MLKNVLQLLFQTILLVLISSCLIWSNLVIYGLEQAKGQLNIIYNAKPIKEVLADKTFPDSLKQKLVLIEEIKKFAVDSLGIKPSDNYSTVYKQSKKPILLTVTACEPYALKPKEWYFPILGSVPYKGFFNLKKAEKEINDLKIQGYDIDVYSPSGWSTLGWFKDPILSKMLYQNEGQLANLIIHELTHGTIFIKNNVMYDENLANFIGDKGAILFLKYKFGDHSLQLKDYEDKKSDEKTYTDYILKSINRLDSLYKSMNPEQSIENKKEKKKNLITEIVLGVNSLKLYKKKNYFNYSLEAFKSKNAFFMSFQRYDSKYEVFENELNLKFKGQLKSYLDYLKQQHSN